MRRCRIRSCVYLLTMAFVGAAAGMSLADGPAPVGAPPVSLREALPKGHGQGLTEKIAWVKRDGAPLKSGPRASDSELRSLKKGTELVILDGGIRLRVRLADGTVGYLPSMYITEVKPRDSITDVGVLSSDDLSPRERSSVSSIRGLSPVAERYAESQQVSEQAISDARKMESISASITEAEMNAFLKEGGVHL